MSIHILGIRHHGVGSAQHVSMRLEQIRPDIVLIEGPPEMEELLSFVGLPQLKPPVAVMIFRMDAPSLSRFYPFAEFSPEWVAAGYANRMGIPIRAIDMPARITLTKETTQEFSPEHSGHQEHIEKPELEADPLQHLASISGFDDSESWWEYQFERNAILCDTTDHFESVLLAMGALRENEGNHPQTSENEIREAYMRQSIRKAQSENYGNIAVVCGAWHAPALQDLVTYEKADIACIRKHLSKKENIYASWIPWTYDRLSLMSGYGAGITSPGWYHHQWQQNQDPEIHWLSKVAETFRTDGVDISSAHVLETYRLAFALSHLRGISHIRLKELNEAIVTVMCMGEPILLELIRKELIVGNRMGAVPDETPKVPLQVNFEKEIKRLRLSLSSTPKIYHLDLRKENDLERSILFHQLDILTIPWASRTSSRTKGTFKESWTLTWQPEMMIALIDKSYLGNTIEAAAIQQIYQQARQTKNIEVITRLVELVIPAQLNDCIGLLLNRMDELSVISTDIEDLMQSMPKLVHISRYGDVRKSDLAILSTIAERLFCKIFIGLPMACYGLDEATSNRFFGWIADLHHAIRIYESDTMTASWHEMLLKIVDKQGIHDIIQGCVCRLLHDAAILSHDETSYKLSLALSISRDPQHVASWMEGFLRGSGMILIYDHRLWNLIFTWIDSLDKGNFLSILPYVKRAFSRFQFGERRQIGEKAKKGLVLIRSSADLGEDENQNMEQIRAIWNTIDVLLGNRMIDLKIDI